MEGRRSTNQPLKAFAGPIQVHLEDFILRTRNPAYLAVTADARVRTLGGALESYGLSDIQPGQNACQRLYFLEGLLPATETPLYLPCVEVESRRFEIHLFRADGLDWILFLENPFGAGP